MKTKYALTIVLMLSFSACSNDAPPFYGGESASDADSDGDADGDADGDTDSDSDSDCEGNGHDEDGDELDDNCDNCPTFHNADQLDQDDDGLGDACEAGWDHAILSEIATFVPFVEPASAFETSGGTWTVGDDTYSGSSTPYGEDAYHELSLSEGAYAVEAVFSYPDAGFNGAKYAGVLFAVQGSGESTTYWECLLERDSHGLSVWTFDNGYQLEGSANNVEGAVAADSWRRVRAIYDGSGLTCVFDNEVANTGEISFVAGELWPDMHGRGGIRVYNETASFHSFTVYR